jgi:hypothetical protein
MTPEKALRVGIYGLTALILFILGVGWLVTHHDKVTAMLTPSHPRPVVSAPPLPPPLLPGEHRMTLNAYAHSGPVHIGANEAVKRLEDAPGIEIRGVTTAGQEYTAYKDWPMDRPGHYKCLPVAYVYFKNTQNRQTMFTYRFVPYQC